MFRKAYTLLALSLLIYGDELISLPTGFQVVAGDANIVANEQLNTLIVENGHKAIIEWNNFSIGREEAMQFLQSGSHSAVLNRVVGGSESALLGQLLSNGNVYLINPSGIFIGPDARIETAGFVASTLDVMNEDFLTKQQLLFSGNSTSSILNLGTISCPSGDITLLARFVKNEGDLLAKNGQVSLVSSPEVLLQLDGKEKIFIRPDLQAISSSKEGAAPLEHTGNIEALAVELRSGASPYLQAIKSSGSIQAISTTEENGEIYLIAINGRTEVTGSLTAKQGDKGGEVRILGEQVIVQESASVDVSGDVGGGKVLIGGDYQGANPDIQNAQVTWMGKDAKINADALVEGDGGKVILWGDQATSFYGTISARGGEVSGDGGLVEVSGKYLDFQGVADRSAPQGKFGTLLLDPVNFTITGVTSANVTPPVLSGSYTVTGCVANTIDAGALGVLLGTGSVIIDTSCSGSSGCGLTGTITVSNPIAWATATTLTLIANQTININANITNTSVAQNFTALECIAAQASVTAGNAKGIVVTAATVTTHAGDIYFQGTGGDAGSNNYGIELNGATLRSITGPGTGNGNITLIGQCSPDNGTPVSNNSGVFITAVGPGGDTIATGGTISILGTCVPGSTGTLNAGVLIRDNATINSTLPAGGGDILIKGVGGGGAVAGVAQDFGILLTTAVEIQTTNHKISMIGIGGNGSGSGSDGIGVLANTVAPNVGAPSIIANGTGSITLEGMAGNGTHDNLGIAIFGFGILPNTLIQTDSGNINLIGTGNGSTINNFGVGISTDASVGSTTGDIIINGTGGLGTNTNYGVDISQSGVVNAGSGNIQIIGEGQGIGTSNIGVNIDTAPSQVTTSGTGNVLINGTAGSGTDNGCGIRVINSAEVLSQNGNITMIGTGKGTGIQNIGIYIDSGTALTPLVSSSGTGEVSIEGTGGNGTTGNNGVQIGSVSGGFAAVSSFDGDLHVIGKGNGANVGVVNSNRGVYLVNNSQIQISAKGVPGTGSILIDGTGGAGTGASTLGCDGIKLETTAMVSAFDGSIRMTGTANGTGSDNSGIYIRDHSQVKSAGTTFNGAPLFLEGNSTSSVGTLNNIGVRIEGLTDAVTTAAHDIEIIGYGSPSATGAGNHGISLGGSAAGLNATVSATALAPTSGSITLTGYGGGAGNATGGGAGVYMVGTTTQSGVFTTSGTVEIFGEGRGVSSPGIFMDPGSRILSRNGNVEMTGISRGTGSLNHGIHLTATTVAPIRATSVSASGTNNGTIVLTGIGSANGTSINDGILIDSGAAVSSLGGQGAASITLVGIGQGTGTDNIGVELASRGTIISSGVGTTNTIHIDGRGSVSGTDRNLGVYIRDQFTSISSNVQDIVIYAESGVVVDPTREALTIEVGSISTSGTTSNIELLARGAFANSGRINVLQGATVSAPNATTGKITVNTPSDMRVFGGSSLSGNHFLVETGGVLNINTSTALPSTTGGFTVNGANGSFVADIGTDLILTGGAMAGTPAVIMNPSGDITITVGGNLSLTGGTNSTNTYAIIGGNTGTGAATSNVLFPSIGGNVTLTGVNDYAAIGYGHPLTSTGPVRGSIKFQQVGGNVSVLGGAVPGARGFAQIGHIAPSTPPAIDLNGDIFINALGSVNVTGGTVAGAYAQIGHGAAALIPPSTLASSAVTVFAGTNIVMTSNTGGSYIVNPSTNSSSAFPHSGSITLITDNINALNPDLAVGNTFTMDPASVISNRPASLGEVRIYRVQQSGSIPNGQVINGVVYNAGAPGVNSTNERFDIWHGSGLYPPPPGTSFVLYYKIPGVIGIICPDCPPIPTTPFIPQLNTMAIADAEIFDLLVKQIGPTQISYLYHGQVCYWGSRVWKWSPTRPSCAENRPAKSCWDCYPGFRRFESFIFENGVDRISPYN